MRLPLAVVALVLNVTLSGQATVDWVQSPRYLGGPLDYDAARGRLLSYDGVYLWSGAREGAPPLHTATTPPYRWWHAMAYDRSRGRLVLFGGAGKNGLLADTWEFDGVNWQFRAPAASPAPRQSHAMGFDVARGRTLLFGGSGTSARYGETWEWDGANWQLHSPVTTPPLDGLLAMAWDAANNELLLFGSVVGSPPSQTWLWNGNNWRRASPATNPSVEYTLALASDPIRQRIVLFGGGALGSSSSSQDTWEWDGNIWHLRSPQHSPPARRFHGMAYDGLRQRVVVVGGEDNGIALRDRWEWDGVDWSRDFASQEPPHLTDTAMAYDVGRDETVLFGGRQPTAISSVLLRSETWLWDGANWRAATPAASPAARDGHALAHAVNRQRTVLFGGRSAAGVLGDTWEWDGVNWHAIVPMSSSPSPRLGAAIVFDDVGQEVVLFGGWSSSMPAAQDTWVWDGVRWLQRTPVTSPPGRSHAALASDSGRARIVLFGGRNRSGLWADTWEWDGMDWHPQFPVSGPSARAEHGMTYDASRRRVVLHGGNGGAYDTWEWDGVTWVPVPTQHFGGGPDCDLTYDRVRQCCTMFAIGWMWLFGDIDRASVPRTGTACGSGGGPALVSEEPWVGRSVRVDILARASFMPAVLAVGSNQITVPLGGGCSLLVGGAVLPRFVVTDGFGVAATTVSIPNVTALRGASLHLQGIVADPASALGLAFTQGLELHIGG